MKKRIIALAAAVSMLPVLPLTGCGEGGTYHTAHFQFTVPNSWFLVSAEDLAEKNYLGNPAGTRYTFEIDDIFCVKVDEIYSYLKVDRIHPDVQEEQTLSGIDCSASTLPAAGWAVTKAGDSALITNAFVYVADKNDSGIGLRVQLDHAVGWGVNVNYGERFIQDMPLLLQTVKQTKDYTRTGGEMTKEGVTVRYSDDWVSDDSGDDRLFRFRLAVCESEDERSSEVYMGVGNAPEGIDSAEAYLQRMAEAYKNRDNTEMEPITDCWLSGYKCKRLSTVIRKEDSDVLHTDFFVFHEGGIFYVLIVTWYNDAGERLNNLLTDTLWFSLPQ